MDPLSNGTSTDAALTKTKKVASKQVASRYLQSAAKPGAQQLDIPPPASKPSMPRQGYSARTTGKWGSSHYSTQTPTPQSSSALHLVDLSGPSPAKSKPTNTTDLKPAKKFVPTTPAVPELPDHENKWALRRPSSHSDTSHAVQSDSAAAAPDGHDSNSTLMDVDEDIPCSSNQMQHNENEYPNSNDSFHENSASVRQTELDKHQERVRQLEEYRQKKQALKLLQTQKKAPAPVLNWRHSLAGQHDLNSRRDSLRGPRMGRPSSPVSRRMTISNPPPKFSTTTTPALSHNPGAPSLLDQEVSASAAAQGSDGQGTSEPSSPAVHRQSRPNSAPSASPSDHPSASQRDPSHSHFPPSSHSAHSARQVSISSNGVSTSAPGPMAPSHNAGLRESMSSTGSGSHQGSHVNEKPLSEAERAENFKRRRRSIQKWELQYRHLNLRAAHAWKQRRDKAESEIHAMLVLTDQHQDEAASLERQAAREQREKLLDDSLATQLPLLEQHHQQQAHSTSVLDALHQSLLAALIHVPLINGACVGSNPSMPDLGSLQQVLHKGVGMMRDLQPALERVLTEPVQASLPSSENAVEAQGDDAAAVASIPSGKGGVELAAQMAKDLSHTMTQEVQQLQDCVELLRRLRAKENQNASYRVQLVQMRQADLL